MNPKLLPIARQFGCGREAIDISPLGNGLINDTFRVATSSGAFVLQRINDHVFPKPEQVMFNLQRLSQHIAQQSADVVHLQIPKALPGLDGKFFFRDQENRFWRALELISPAESREQISRQTEAEQIGFALAHFHRLCGELPTELLYDTLPGFHIAPGYFQRYQTLIRQTRSVDADNRFEFCRGFIEAFHGRIDVLEQAKQQGLLVERVIHGDPKLNNFLFEPDSDRIISLIDLDTVKPGLVHYDIGDCIRSCCHIAENNRFDLDRCESILTSYLREAGHFFNDADFDYLYEAILLIPFELGLRFFSDYLAGNLYFRVSDSDENLRRAIAQFQLCENIALQREFIEKMISDLKLAA
ncbi:MAG: phosphotransferase enzyme family protein [Methylomonas sp.]